MTNSSTRPLLSEQEGTESPSLFSVRSWVNRVIPHQEINGFLIESVKDGHEGKEHFVLSHAVTTSELIYMLRLYIQDKKSVQDLLFGFIEMGIYCRLTLSKTAIKDCD